MTARVATRAAASGRSPVAGLLVAALIGVAVSSASCASTSEGRGSWRGRPFSTLVSAWGEPDSSTELNDGRTVYTWRTYWRDRYGENTCRRTFTVGADERVENWSFTNCPRW